MYINSCGVLNFVSSIIIIVYSGAISILILIFSLLVMCYISPIEHFSIVGSIFSNTTFSCCISLIVVFMFSHCMPYFVQNFTIATPILLSIFSVNTLSLITFVINPFTQIVLSVFISLLIIIGSLYNVVYRAGFSFISIFIPSGVPLLLTPLVFLLS